MQKITSFLRFVSVCIGFLHSHVLWAQTIHTGGIVNYYTGVSSINFCDNKVTVDNPNGFTAGKRVIMIQMRGAEINTSNNYSFGDITDYKGCGNYEILTIKSVAGNVIEFTYVIARNYEVAGKVQLISLEEYNTLVIDSALRAKPWDGASGGMIAVKADTIILNDSVTVKGLGLRGALMENDNNSQACYNSGIGGATDFYCSTLNCGAPKGEGIGNSTYGYGRGKNGNSGGGGDDHNTGGGGGSNYGAGGKGGTRTNASQFSCPGPAPGEGGGALAYNTTNNKVFMGGGGGAGDENNNQGSNAGNGGGIVLFMADVLVGNGRKINANGDRVTTVAKSDGASGGGAGGTVLLYVNSVSGSLEVNTNGGNGGNLTNGNDPDFCFGPGGGGGAGVLWVKPNAVPAGITLIDTGGINGKSVYALGTSICPYGTTNGALPGQPGGSVTGLTLTESLIPFVKLTLSACCDTTVCAGSFITMSETDTATFPPTVTWSNGATTSTFTEQVFTTTVYTVTVTDHRGCGLFKTMTATVQNAIPNVSICCDTIVCNGSTVTFTVSAPSQLQLTYNWSSGQQTSTISTSISSSQVFNVTVTDQNGCSVEESVQALVNNNPPPLTVCCDTVVCSGSSVSLSAVSTVGGLTYNWSTGQNTADVIQSVSASQTITLTVTDVNGCVNNQSVQVVVPLVTTAITAIPDSAIALGQSIQLLAQGDSSYTFTWSPASGLNHAVIRNPLATPDVTTLYCVTVSDVYHCTADACYRVELILPDVKVPDAFSPNADGTNDVLSIFPLKFADILEVRVYNRWGEVIFYSKGNGAWDGTYQSKPQPEGAYVCEVTYTSILNPAKTNRVIKDILLLR